MKLPLLPSLCLVLALSATAHAQVQAQLGDVSDNRTTGKFFAGLNVEIKLVGDGLADAKFVKASVTAATDDTGRDLVDAEKEKEKSKFEDVSSHGQGSNLKLELKNPSRKASTIKELTGEADLFIPKNDPDAVLKIANFQKSGGTPISSPALTAAGIEITTFTKEQIAAAKAKQEAAAKANPSLKDALQEAFGEMMGGSDENSLTVRIKDPGQKLVEIEFQDASGKRVRTNGWSSFGDPAKQLTKSYDFQSKLPEDTTLVIYIATPKALVKVPFSLKDIFLP